jgi:hypothetical protein
MGANGHPNVDVYKLNSPGQATAGTDSTFAIDRVKRAGTVTAVTYAPNADITGAATNNRTFSLINKGADGNGTTVVATLSMANGVNASDFDEKTIPLSGTAANLAVAEGDMLAWFSDAVNTGMVDPGGVVRVEVATTGAGHSSAGYVRGFPAV